jgi:pyridoxine kinase
VISSLTLDDDPLLAPSASANPDESIICLCSSIESTNSLDESPAPSTVHFMRVPRINGYFSGVGDLFSALVVAHFDPTRASDSKTRPGHPHERTTALSIATSRAVNTTHAVLVSTNNYCHSLPPEERPPTDDEMDKIDQNRRSRRMRARELRIIQSLDMIREGGGSPLGEMQEWKDFW